MGRGLLCLALLIAAFLAGLLLGRHSCSGTEWRHVDAAVAWWRWRVSHRREAAFLVDAASLWQPLMGTVAEAWAYMPGLTASTGLSLLDASARR